MTNLKARAAVVTHQCPGPALAAGPGPTAAGPPAGDHRGLGGRRPPGLRSREQEKSRPNVRESKAPRRRGRGPGPGLRHPTVRGPGQRAPSRARATSAALGDQGPLNEELPFAASFGIPGRRPGTEALLGPGQAPAACRPGGPVTVSSHMTRMIPANRLLNLIKKKRNSRIVNYNSSP